MRARRGQFRGKNRTGRARSHHDVVVVTLDFFIRCVDHCSISRYLKAEFHRGKDLRQRPHSGLKRLLINERVQPGDATITLFEKVCSRVMERLTWHPATPPASRYIVHDLDLTRDRVAVFWEVFANLCSRFVNTFAAHNATAGMDPKAIFGVRLGEQCRTLEGIELYKNLIEVAHEQFRRSCAHNWLSLN